MSDTKVAAILEALGGELLSNEHKGCRRFICHYELNDELVLSIEE